ncbi:MAG: DUF4890 domain-containing protein [Dysgonamonadaceae bacterium]|nr:DUF4890 domain-containing protein [Dysgonamonadaceae bacterium]
MAVLLCLSTVIYAQNQRERRGPGNGNFDPQNAAKRQTEWMTKELNLNEKQTKRVDSINVAFAKKQQEMFQNRERNENVSNEQRQAAREKLSKKMRELNAQKEAAVAKVLSKEQLELYRKKAQEMSQQRGQGNRRPQNNQQEQKENNRTTRPSRNTNS